MSAFIDRLSGSSPRRSPTASASSEKFNMMIARIGLAYGVITKADIEASAALVIEPTDLALHLAGSTH